MVMYTFSVFDEKYPFWGNFVQNVKIISLTGNFAPRLIRICQIQQWYSLFFPFRSEIPFLVNFVKKVEKISLRSNLVPTIIRICRIQW